MPDINVSMPSMQGVPQTAPTTATTIAPQSRPTPAPQAGGATPQTRGSSSSSGMARSSGKMKGSGLTRTLTPLVNKRLTTISQTATYEPYTPWMQAVGVDAVRALLIARDMLGEFDWQFGIQTAAVDPSRPDAWAALASAQTTAIAYCTGNTSISASLASKMWVRFGVKYNRRDSSPTYAQADMNVQTSLVARGMLAGRMPAMTLATLGSTTWQTAWTSRWIPAQWVDKVRAGVWIGGITNAPAVRLAYQTADERPSDPNTWLELMTTGTPQWTTAGDKNLGELPTSGTPFAAPMWVRIGVQYKSTAGAQDLVTVGAVVGVRRT